MSDSTNLRKTCFVIMPISDPQPYDAGHFTAVYHHIIRPACEQAGFAPLRADEVNQTNLIALDVLERIAEAEMAICDISARNPNVLYELGIRHALRKPVVLLKDSSTERVFDIDGLRRIEYDKSLRIDLVSDVVAKLVKAIAETHANPYPDDGSLMRMIEREDGSPESRGTSRERIEVLTPAESDARSRERTQLVGVVDNWNVEKGFGFIRTDDESFYSAQPYLAQGLAPVAGRTAFFVPATPTKRGGHRVASCVFCMHSEVKAKVVYTNTNRGFGFAQVEDAHGNAQQIYVQLNSLAEPPKEGDTVYLTVRRNDLGPIGIGVQNRDDGLDLADEAPSSSGVSSDDQVVGSEVMYFTEDVVCPGCGSHTNTRLGESIGSSAVSTCSNCRERFHVHRRSGGEPFVNKWGGSSTIRLTVKCPRCDKQVPLNFRVTNLAERRFCMSCNAELTIDMEGKVLESSPQTPTAALSSTYAAGRWYLTCPHCTTPVPTFWSVGSVHKAVCKPCHVLMEGICEQPEPPAVLDSDEALE